MAKLIPDAILDLMLDQAEGTTIHVCSGQPTDYATALSLALATGAVGTYTKANGDVSGRKNTQAGALGLSITVTGTADHVAITNGVDTLKLVTTATAQGLTSGGTVDVGAFDHEILDAV